MTSPIKIAVAGASGRMGRAILPLLAADPDFAFVGGIGREGSAGDGLIDRSAAIGAADVILDFTTGRAAAELVGLCASAGGPALVIGATGFEPDELERIAEAARTIPILRSGNFSIGVNMLVGLVAQAARALPAHGWDIEILEAHHNRKIDAPSGTALMLGEAAAEGRGVSSHPSSGAGVTASPASARPAKLALPCCAPAGWSENTACSLPPPRRS